MRPVRLCGRATGVGAGLASPRRGRRWDADRHTARRCGGPGYLLKSASKEEFLDAVRRTAGG
ncbi:hypothetical protein ABT130_39385, partial [Streptosporangium sp. NPDC001681]